MTKPAAFPGTLSGAERDGDLRCRALSAPDRSVAGDSVHRRMAGQSQLGREVGDLDAEVRALRAPQPHDTR